MRNVRMFSIYLLLLYLYNVEGSSQLGFPPASAFNAIGGGHYSNFKNGYHLAVVLAVVSFVWNIVLTIYVCQPPSNNQNLNMMQQPHQQMLMQPQQQQPPNPQLIDGFLQRIGCTQMVIEAFRANGLYQDIGRWDRLTEYDLQNYGFTEQNISMWKMEYGQFVSQIKAQQAQNFNTPRLNTMTQISGVDSHGFGGPSTQMQNQQPPQGGNMFGGRQQANMGMGMQQSQASSPFGQQQQTPSPFGQQRPAPFGQQHQAPSPFGQQHQGPSPAGQQHQAPSPFNRQTSSFLGMPQQHPPPSITPFGSQQPAIPGFSGGGMGMQAQPPPHVASSPMSRGQGGFFGGQGRGGMPHAGPPIPAIAVEEKCMEPWTFNLRTQLHFPENAIMTFKVAGLTSDLQFEQVTTLELALAGCGLNRTAISQWMHKYASTVKKSVEELDAEQTARIVQLEGEIAEIKAGLQAQEMKLIKNKKKIKKNTKATSETNTQANPFDPNQAYYDPNQQYFDPNQPYYDPSMGMNPNMGYMGGMNPMMMGSQGMNMGQSNTKVDNDSSSESESTTETSEEDDDDVDDFFA